MCFSLDDPGAVANSVAEVVLQGIELSLPFSRCLLVPSLKLGLVTTAGRLNVKNISVIVLASTLSYVKTSTLRKEYKSASRSLQKLPLKKNLNTLI